MIQLEILNGAKAGTRWVSRRWPVRVGRDKQAALCLPDEGVWEGHLEFHLRPGEGCLLTPRHEALTVVNGERIQGSVRLRNGDRIDLGSVSLCFTLSPTEPSSSAWVESLVWIGLAAVCLGQVALIYLVLP